MTLPTREEANQSAMYCDWIGNPDGRLIVEAYAEGELMSRVEWEATIEAEHQHQFLPWLTLPNGSSWTGCASCDWQYQYDH